MCAWVAVVCPMCRTVCVWVHAKLPATPLVRVWCTVLGFSSALLCSLCLRCCGAQDVERYYQLRPCVLFVVSVLRFAHDRVPTAVLDTFAVAAALVPLVLPGDDAIAQELLSTYLLSYDGLQSRLLKGSDRRATLHARATLLRVLEACCYTPRGTS